MKRTLISWTAAALLLVPTFAAAQSDSDIGFRGWGPRLGVTSGPDQVHFGVHADFAGDSEHLRLQPNFELGIGDDQTIGAINMEAAYRFSSTYTNWSPYVGGGVGLNIIGSDEGLTDNTDTEAGINAIVGLDKGLSSGDRFFAESKFGLTGQTPDLKLTAGWTFYH
jgi:hypothetical protein